MESKLKNALRVLPCPQCTREIRITALAFFDHFILVTWHCPACGKHDHTACNYEGRVLPRDGKPAHALTKA